MYGSVELWFLNNTGLCPCLVLSKLYVYKSYSLTKLRVSISKQVTNFVCIHNKLTSLC